MIARTWEDCRRLWSESDWIQRMSPEEIAARWADGRCGQCGQTFDDHMTQVATADAVLLRPLPPVDALTADIILGRLFGKDLEAFVAAAALVPDSKELPA